MNDNSNLTGSVALRHIVEDAIAILEAKHLPEERKQYVLSELIQLTEGASRGSTLLRDGTLFVTQDDRAAYESYSLLDRYLNHSLNQQWREGLQTTLNSLSMILSGQAPPTEAIYPVLDLFRQLLRGLERESASELNLIPNDFELVS